jgi:hypothetical protein
MTSKIVTILCTLALASGCAVPVESSPGEAPTGESQAALESICPDPARAVPFDEHDPLEAQLSAIGCSAKTLMKEQDGRAWFTAFCPEGSADASLIARYGHVDPYDLRVAHRACEATPAGTVVDVWDPTCGASCLQ